MRIFLLITTLLSLNCFGQMNTDRPAYSYSAQTIRKGEFQIEAGTLLNNGADGGPSLTYIYAPFAQFRIGVADVFELRLQNGIKFRRDPIKRRLKSSMDNFELGFKYNFVHGKKMNTSFIAQGIVPTGSGEQQFEEAGVRAILAFDHRIKQTGRFGYNFGGVWSSIDQGIPSLQAYYTIFYEHKINSNLAIFGEVFHLFPGVEEFDVELMEVNVDFGLTYALRTNLQLDYSFGFNLLQRQNFQSLGLSYRIKPNPKPRMY